MLTSADFVMLGAGEELFIEVADVYSQWKGSGKTRKEFLETIARIDGIYVPSFYDVEYNEDGTVSKITKNNENAADKPVKRIIREAEENGKLILRPHIPSDWNYLKLENLTFRGKKYDITYDKNGDLYGVKGWNIVEK